MFTTIREKLSETTRKVADKVGEYSEPARIAILEHRLKAAEAQMQDYKGRCYIYLHEVSTLNRSLGRKSMSIRGLRAKIERMAATGQHDPREIEKVQKLIKAGVIDPEKMSPGKRIAASILSDMGIANPVSFKKSVDANKG